MNTKNAPANWTFLELLNWTADYFSEVGIEDARLNAELLLSEATGLERIMLYAKFEEKASPGIRDRYREMVKKRAQRCPLQYILGHTEFYGRDFCLDESTLIPRPETELLVDRCLELISSDFDASSVKIADIGTGSGAIAVTLACEKPKATLLATDISQKALKTAQKNAEKHNVDDRIEFFCGNMLTALPKNVVSGEERLDFIVSNPPYIPSRSLHSLQPEISQWEPVDALDGGEDGLKYVSELIDGAEQFLKPAGRLILELGEDQGGRVSQRFFSHNKWCTESLEIIKDDAGCGRVLVVSASE